MSVIPAKMSADVLQHKARNAPSAISPKTRPHYSKASAQAVEIQRLLAEDAVNAKDGKERAFIARAWCDVNEERRKLAMRPLPKPVDVSKLPKRGRRSQSSNEPIEPDMLPGAK